MEDIIIITVLLAIIGGIVLYLYKAKKRGERCVGCPYSKGCGGKCNSASGSAKADNEENKD